MTSILTKAFKKAENLEKDEIFDLVFWCRQIIALSFGLACGIFQITGLSVIFGFFVLFFLLSYIYYSKILQINEDDFGQNELIMEGVADGFGLFMLSWIVSYTLVL